MKTLRLAVLSTVVAVLTGCPGGGDKCKDVMCPSGQSCDSNTGMCVNGNAGGGSGGSGGNTGGGNTGGGGGSGGGTVDAGQPIPINQLCERLAAAQCDKMERCKTLDTVDKTACLALTKDNCTLDDAVNNMVARYDGAAAADCIARLAVSDCSDTSNPPSCSAAFVGGTGQSGVACLDNTDCQADAGLYCRGLNDCGSCTPYAAAGQGCNSVNSAAGRAATTCQPGLSCSNSTDGGTCVVPSPVGQPCTTTLTSTTNGRACDVDAGYCPSAPTDGGARLCQPYVAADATCSASLLCGRGLFCPPAGTMPRTCRTLIADGQPCTTGTQCAAGYCNRDPFTYSSFDVDDGGARTCGLIANGSSCFADDDCASGLCKDFHVPRPDAGYVFGTCAVPDSLGAACTNSETRGADSCADSNATCLDGTCKVTIASVAVGGSCDYLRQCKWPGYCDLADPYTLEGHCTTAYKDAGVECNTDIECGVDGECYLDFNTFTQSCLRFAHAGEICDFNVGPDCLNQFLQCSDNPDGGPDTICLSASPPGGACSEFGQVCYSSYCAADGGCVAPKLAVGQSCDGNGQCESGRCSNPDGGADVCIAACY